MTPPRHYPKMALLIVLATGCSSTDGRLARQVAKSNRQQAEQNQEMASKADVSTASSITD